VRITLSLKSIPDSVPITYHPVDVAGSEHRSSQYLSMNPNASVPTLIVEYASENTKNKTLTITQSPAILDWLDQNFPEPPLLPPPSDPWARARAQEFASLVIADIQPPQATRWRNKIAADYRGDGKAWAKFVYERGFSVYESLLSRSISGAQEDSHGTGGKGRYSVGDEITLADVCLVPAAQGGLRIGIDLDKWPLVKGVVEECWKLLAFSKGGLGQHGRLQP